LIIKTEFWNAITVISTPSKEKLKEGGETLQKGRGGKTSKKQNKNNEPGAERDKPRGSMHHR